MYLFPAVDCPRFTYKVFNIRVCLSCSSSTPAHREMAFMFMQSHLLQVFTFGQSYLLIKELFEFSY